MTRYLGRRGRYTEHENSGQHYKQYFQYSSSLLISFAGTIIRRISRRKSKTTDKVALQALQKAPTQYEGHHGREYVGTHLRM